MYEYLILTFLVHRLKLSLKTSSGIFDENPLLSSSACVTLESGHLVDRNAVITSGKFNTDVSISPNIPSVFPEMACVTSFHPGPGRGPVRRLIARPCSPLTYTTLTLPLPPEEPGTAVP